MELLFLLPMLLAGLLLDAATSDDPDEPAEDEAAEPAAARAAAEDSPEEPEEEEEPEAAKAEPARIEGFDPAEDRLVLDLPPDAEGEVQLLAQDGGTLLRVDGADIAFLAGVPPQAIGPETLVFGAETPAA